MSLTKVSYSMIKGASVNVLDYGAVGDGIADDSSAIQSALAATPSGGVLSFPAGVYIVDYEFILTQPITLRGPGTIKLKDNSALFNDYTNPYGRSIIVIRSSDVTIDGVTFDGNSPNNYWIDGGVKYYNVSTGGNVRSVDIIFGGFYGAGIPAPSDIQNISIRGCTFYDAPWGSFVSLMQGNVYPDLGSNKYIRNLSFTGNFFQNGQGLQIAVSHVKGCIVTGNTFSNAYFAAFQYYYDNSHCLVTGNTFYFNRNDIDWTLVNPDNQVDGFGIPTYYGQVRMGKFDTIPNYDCHFDGNTLRGAPILWVDGMNYSSSNNNVSFESESVGILIIPGGYNNSVCGNKISLSDQPGLVLDDLTVAGATFNVSNNEVEDCCTKILASTYSSRDMNSQVSIWDTPYQFNNNIIKRSVSTVKYAVAYNTVSDVNNIYSSLNNYCIGAGTVADAIVSDGGFPETVVLTLPNANSPPDFSAYLNTELSNVTGNNTLFYVPLGSITYNVRAAYNPVNGYFTCPIPGRYAFKTSIYIKNLSTATSVFIGITKNFSSIGTTQSTSYYTLNPAIGGAMNASAEFNVELAIGDTIRVFVQVNGVGADTVDIGDTFQSSVFMGSLLQ